MAKAKTTDEGNAQTAPQSAVEHKLDALIGAVGTLAKNVGDVVESIKKPEVKVPEVKTDEAAPQVAEKPSMKFPVPTEFRESADTILNKFFDLEVEYNTGTFTLSVLVPKKYSNAPSNHWETYHEDRRSKVIETAKGAHGAREWFEKVYNNLTPESRSSVVFDRAQPGL